MDTGRPEILEQATTAAGRRRLRLFLVSAVLLLVAAGAVDLSIRRDERVALSHCVRASRAAMDGAGGRLAAMLAYVGPTLATTSSQALRRGLLGMISSEAVPTEAALRRARDLCRGTEVLLTHSSLRESRTDCLRLLTGKLADVRALRTDGLQLSDPGRLQDLSCSLP